MPDLMWQECASDFRGWGHWHNWMASTLSGPETHRVPLGHRGLSSFQTHPGQSTSSLTPWLRSCRISILDQSVGLSDAWHGAVKRAFGHVGVISTINVSFQYDWMNIRNFGTYPYLDYYFVFRHDFRNPSPNGYSPFALANFAQFCSQID